jgi:hypothetical protein
MGRLQSLTQMIYGDERPKQFRPIFGEKSLWSTCENASIYSSALPRWNPPLRGYPAAGQNGLITCNETGHIIR